MKITSINFITRDQVPHTVRNTERAQNVAQILTELQKAPEGKALRIDGELKKFERYSLQKQLQARGAHVTVKIGVNPQTAKPCIYVDRLSDSEWKEWMAGSKETARKFKK